MSRARIPRLLGVIHLPPLPGSPGAAGMDPASAMQVAGQRAVREAQALSRAGFEGLILENFGDIPFTRGALPPEALATFAIIAAAVREATRVPVGLNFLRNDARSALATAAVTGCDFIRVNVLSGVAATDQGLIEGCAAELLRDRARLGRPVGILADVQVKHAVSLSTQDLGLALEECALRAGADGVIVTGPTTGRPVEPVDLARAAESARECGVPLWVGSGTTPGTISDLLFHADGVIVGSALRRGGKAGAPLEDRRVREIVRAFRSARRRSRSSAKRPGLAR